MRFEVFVALRHILSRRRQTILSIAAVALAIAMAVASQSMMNGFTREMLEVTVEDMPHVTIKPREGEEYVHLYRSLMEDVGEMERVEAVAPFLVGQATLSHEDNVENVGLQGIDPGRQPRVSRIEEHLVRGSLSDLEQADRVLLGDALAEELEVGVGDMVTASFPDATPQNLRVVGIIDTRSQADDSLAYTSLDTVQRFQGIRAVSGVSVSISDYQRAEEMAVRIEQRTGYPAEPWTETNPEILQTITIETLSNDVLLGLILIIASLGIVSTLALSVMERTQQIGMLMAMGTTPRQIMTIFVLESGLLGLMGAIVGSLLGAGLSIALSYYPITMPEGLYPISTIPVVLRPIDMVVFTVIAFIVNLVAGVYPARRAARLDPVEAIRGD